MIHVYDWQRFFLEMSQVQADVRGGCGRSSSPFLKGDRGGFYGGHCQASRQVPLPKIPPGLPLEKGGANLIYRPTLR